MRQVKARGMGQAVALAQGVPARVDQVSGLQLVLDFLSFVKSKIFSP